MSRIDASRSVAAMKDMHSLGYFSQALRDEPCNAVREFAATLNHESSVIAAWASITTTEPEPAIIGASDLDLRPEAFVNRH